MRVLPFLFVIFFLTSVLAVPVPSGEHDDQDGEQSSPSDWRIEVVDFAGDVGSYTSMDIDSNGYAHISYDSYANAEIRYAKWTGSAWIIETVDSTSDVGWYTSIALDSNDNPHISYYDFFYNFDLKYAKWTHSPSGKWIIQVVDSAGDVGRHASIALDSNDNPHIAYFDYTNSDLKYAKWTGSIWNIETVDSASNVGAYASMALDSNDNLHISYVGNGILKYARLSGSTWSSEIVDAGSRVSYTSIALDSNDNPHISYQDYIPNYDLKYAMWNGTAWNVELVDAIGVLGGWTSLALDSNNMPHISYYDQTNADLKYATKADLQPPSRSISLNIDPDTLNLKSKGRWITAYLSTNASVYDVNTSSILLQDTLIPERWDYQDDILMLKFNRQDLIAILEVGESVEIKLSGKWKEGSDFEAYDYIRVINPGKK